MKREERITCDVIKDLLPLYEDGCCSGQTRKIVEDHLAQCEVCRKRRDQFAVNLPAENIQEEADVRQIRSGMKKLSFWKRGGIAVICLVLAIVLIIIPAWNYMRGSGITYVNLQAVHTAKSFGKALISGDYEKAYGYLAIEAEYESLLDTEDKLSGLEDENESVIAEGIAEIREKGYEWYDDVCHDKFVESMQILAALGENIKSMSDFRIMTAGPGCWQIRFDICTLNGTDAVMCLQIDAEGIRNMYISTISGGSDELIGEEAMPGEMDKWELIRDRLYRMPSINETVMEILYEDTDYEWERLFEY